MESRLTADDLGGRGVDVWRGELHVGDGLLLVSRNMTETVGTEELKSAVLTLHPQAAVEHLHHLFGGVGSGRDAGRISGGHPGHHKGNGNQAEEGDNYQQNSFDDVLFHRTACPFSSARDRPVKKSSAVIRDNWLFRH